MKMTGAGNDFILIDNVLSSLDMDWPIMAPQLCDRRFGIGADGLLVIEKSSNADFKMLYYNADGTFGGMCGNGGRCAASYVMSKQNKDQVRFEALDYSYSAQRVAKDIHLKMKSPILHDSVKTVQLSTHIIPIRLIDSGSPHAVIFTRDLPSALREEVREVGIKNLGKLIRNHNQFAPSGVNVDFLETTGPNEISMRTYERGVEDETLACGTGAVASAMAAAIVEHFTSPLIVKTQSNEVLTVRFRKDGINFSHVELIGPVKFVFRGQVAVQCDNFGAMKMRIAYAS